VESNKGKRVDEKRYIFLLLFSKKIILKFTVNILGLILAITIIRRNSSNMKNILKSISIASIMLLAFTGGCKDTVTNQQIDDTIIPSSNVLFGKHIQPLFNVKCTSSGCHDDVTRAGSLSLTSWTNAHVPGIINDYDPETSRLVWAIEGQLGSNSMPPFGYPSLTKNQIDGIKTWIKEGAKNN
jgi:hypothetical protein